MGKPGRPQAKIDWERVGQMCEAGCSGVGIASTFGIDEATLRKRCQTDQRMSFSEFQHQKRARGNELLRMKQMQVAMSGDKTMLIWLGKQRLDQSEKSEAKVTTINEREVDWFVNAITAIAYQHKTTEAKAAAGYLASEKGQNLKPELRAAIQKHYKLED